MARRPGPGLWVSAAICQPRAMVSAASCPNRRRPAPSGTLAGNALSLAAGRATLAEVLTDDAHRRMSTLASRLAERLQNIIAARGLISY
jgi:glutamate-1-semialdehyde aminotransferase